MVVKNGPNFLKPLAGFSAMGAEKNIFISLNSVAEYFQDIPCNYFLAIYICIKLITGLLPQH